MIKVTDTDVLVIAIHGFSSLKAISLEELWLAVGTGVNLRWILVHDLYSRLGQEKTNSLPFFPCIHWLRCICFPWDKRIAWQTWSMFPEIWSVFTKLSTYHISLLDEDQRMLKESSFLCMTGQPLQQT
jgi:hypothetical protein